jgi:hypothetical protein
MWLIFQDDFLDFPDIYCKRKADGNGRATHTETVVETI